MSNTFKRTQKYPMYRNVHQKLCTPGQSLGVASHPSRLPPQLEMGRELGRFSLRVEQSRGFRRRCGRWPTAPLGQHIFSFLRWIKESRKVHVHVV